MAGVGSRFPSGETVSTDRISRMMKTEDNNRIRVKICGLMTEEDCRIVNRFRPDYAGFVFADTRHRISDETAAMLRKNLDPAIHTAGVFVDDAPEHVAALAASGTIDMIQLHGREDHAYIAELRRLLRETLQDGRWQRTETTEIPLIRAARVRDGSEILPAQALDTEYLLLDTFDPHVPGGSGRRFDLSLLPPLMKPWFLAGGLTPDNIFAVLEETEAGTRAGDGHTMPLAVDVSSGVESEKAGGHKDAGLVERFLSEVRHYEQNK